MKKRGSPFILIYEGKPHLLFFFGGMWVITRMPYFYFWRLEKCIAIVHW